jgi:hypothetical protein
MSKTTTAMCLLIGGFIPAVMALQIEAELRDGLITYIADDGSRKSIDVGKRCSDLWVSPDQSFMAFIAIDRSTGPDSEGNSLILGSSIYIARRSERFTPIRVALKPVRIFDRDWQVFRTPKLLPDGAAVSFTVPHAATAGALFVHDLKTGSTRMVANAVVAHCVVWGGAKAGTILTQRRRLIDLELRYPCYASDSRNGDVQVADECGYFEGFSYRWSQSEGGSCN